MSSTTQAVSKKRKKPDTKPQSQINKCLNEKRRREQENTYIEELAELIQASIASDMSSLSVKPDKCAILQQTVNQIRRIKAAEGTGEGAVQQGEVSSSKPTLLPTQRLGPLLLEALDGFLFLVSNEGKIEFVSDKVSHFIKFTSEDLTGKSIYNIIHVGDHPKFSSCFLSLGWSSEPPCDSSRNRSFNCRLLVRPPDDQEETMEERQQRVSQYENMQISTVLLPSYFVDKNNSESFEGEGQQCLVCLVRRIPPNERIQGTPVEQFTTKLDNQGTIIAIDASGVSPRYSHYISKERIGERFIELIPPGDVGKVTGHLQETVQSGQATSQVYRVKIGGDRYIRVQTKSKLFRDTDGTQVERSFMMATHSIIGPFQEGNGSSTADRLHAGTSGNGGSLLDESLSGRPSSTGAAGDDSGVSSIGDNTRLRKLLSHGESGSDLPSDNSNKILKDLLNQKDEDDTQGGIAGGVDGNSTLERLMSRVPSHHDFKPNTSSSPAVNSTANNMLRENQPPSQHLNPQGLPQEKLPKDLEKKLQTSIPWQPSGRNQSEILNQLLIKGPSNTRSNVKVNTAMGSNMGMNPQLRTPTPTSIMGGQGGVGAQGHMTSQPSLSSQSGIGVNNINISGSGTVSTTLGGRGTVVSVSGVSVLASSMSTTTTNTLPSFKSSMGLNVLDPVSSSFPDGSLPSITTSFPSVLQNHNDDFLRESVINDILEMTNNFPGGLSEDSGMNHEPSLDDVHRSSTSSAQEMMEIQKIQNSLMSEIEAQGSSSVAGPGSLPPYTAVPSVQSHGSYPPPYTQRIRFPSAGPAGGPGGGTNIGGHMSPASMMRPSTQQFAPGSPTVPSRPTMNNQRALLRQQETRKRLLQHQQQQVLVPSNTSDVAQPPPTSYQNMDDLFNNTVAPNVNVTLQRNVAESQTSPNYNLLNSPLGGGGQISPGQRIPQPPFSPHGQTTSPLPNQQYSNSGQMGGYQGAQGSQLSPRLSQGSPVPPSYQPGGQPLPQMSPTGPGTPGTPVVQVPPGQQSPVWSSPSPQQRPSLMTQNPMLNAQLSSFIRNDGGRQFQGGGRNQLPSMRSVPSPSARQSPYQGIGPHTPGATGQGDSHPYPPSSPQQGQSPLIYQQQQQQQQQQQYRIQRTMSAPGQMAESNKWGGESVNPSQAGGLNVSPRMEDSRTTSGSDKGKSESMLKHLLSK
ncbi:hypothetical protein OTU49_010709 [Cherax quadricarinatus]|uniref:Uncharacterized protein n=1 Tax=Cherax quadricarinatus TaxID=27406 RepID=A0AAW0WDD8_CHEQU